MRARGEYDERSTAAIAYPGVLQGNPAATFLAAGLLHGAGDPVGAIFVQEVGDATPAGDVLRVLAELGLDMGGWRPQIVTAAPVVPIDVGLTICVPT